MPTTLALTLAALAAVLVAWFVYRRVVEVPCRIELEATQGHFHAHVELQGVEVREGDEVLVRGAPRRIAIDSHRELEGSATVHQASLPRRLWTRLVGRTHITDLYDVGFEG